MAEGTLHRQPRSLSKIDPRRRWAALGMGDRERERGSEAGRARSSATIGANELHDGLNAVSDNVLERRQGGAHRGTESGQEQQQQQQHR